MCKGAKRPVIAARLRLNRHTVNTHIDRLHKKLGVKEKSEILALAARFAMERRRKR